MIISEKGSVTVEGKTLDLYLEMLSIFSAFLEEGKKIIPKSALRILLEAADKPETELMPMVISAILCGCSEASGNCDIDVSPEDIGDMFFGRKGD